MRLPQLNREDLAPEYVHIFDSIASTHAGKVSGPFAVWIHSPEIAEGADAFRNSFRSSSLAPRLYQLLVLTVAAHWNAPYPWSVHERTVVTQNLLPAEILAAIADGAEPPFGADVEAAHLYTVVSELLATGGLGDETYADCETVYGPQLLVEIVTIAGFYSSACLLANAFAIPPVSDVPARLTRGGTR